MLAMSCHQIHKLSLQAPKLGDGGDKDARAIEMVKLPVCFN